jgi:DNA replication protein DnaC
MLNSACQKCRYINEAKQRFANSNIPIRYWNLEMMRDFKGDENLLEKYKEIVADLSSTYKSGMCICFAGSHGLGKTLVTTNILKRASEKGYNCLYVTLSDIVELVTSSTPEKAVARKELLMVDFLVIDEFDPRHMGGTSNATDLFGRTLENIFRTRSQNVLPIFMCTNSPNVVDSFTGPIKQSIDSLMNYVEIVPVLGQDFRRQKK